MRGKRAYIKIDGEKYYLAWSGPIKIADKSKFLRGDFEKAKEESQPIEETHVQEQESASKPCTFCQGKGCNFCGGSGKVDANIEVKQEEEAEKNGATDDIASKLEKLTKLFEEGILTKEELKRKSDELISQI